MSKLTHSPAPCQAPLFYTLRRALITAWFAYQSAWWVYVFARLLFVGEVRLMEPNLPLLLLELATAAALVAWGLVELVLLLRGGDHGHG